MQTPLNLFDFDKSPKPWRMPPPHFGYILLLLTWLLLVVVPVILPSAIGVNIAIPSRRGGSLWPPKSDHFVIFWSGQARGPAPTWSAEYGAVFLSQPSLYAAAWRWRIGMIGAMRRE
jgi:hypothetical protein